MSEEILYPKYTLLTGNELTLRFQNPQQAILFKEFLNDILYHDDKGRKLKVIEV